MGNKNAKLGEYKHDKTRENILIKFLEVEWE